jgi:hypothetical protein
VNDGERDVIDCAAGSRDEVRRDTGLEKIKDREIKDKL